MNVKELIERLNDCNPDKEITLLFDDGYGEESCDEVIEEKDKVFITEKLS